VLVDQGIRTTAASVQTPRPRLHAQSQRRTSLHAHSRSSKSAKPTLRRRLVILKLEHMHYKHDSIAYALRIAAAAADKRAEVATIAERSHAGARACPHRCPPRALCSAARLQCRPSSSAVTRSVSATDWALRLRQRRQRPSFLRPMPAGRRCRCLARLCYCRPARQARVCRRCWGGSACHGRRACWARGLFAHGRSCGRLAICS